MILSISFYDIIQKILTNEGYFQISVDSKFSFKQAMHDCMHWHCSIDYCVNLKNLNDTENKVHAPVKHCSKPQGTELVTL